MLRGPVIAGLARAARADILRAAEAVAPAERKRIHTFIGTSPLHMEYQLRMQPDEVLVATAETVTLARQHTDDVEWSAMDATPLRSRFPLPLRGGRDHAPAPPRSTCPTPSATRCPKTCTRMFTMLRERVPGAEKVIFSTHNHNDLGLAVANTLAAVAAGVRQIECTINGIGERAGNASLEEVVMAIRTRHDAIACKTQVATTNILKTSQLLATVTGFDVQPNKAIVGRNAFAHEAGIHQDGVLKNAATYEIMTPESVGWTDQSLVMGKHSGRAAFRDKLRALGYGEIGDNPLNDAFRRFKDLADRKKAVFDEDIAALVDDEVMRDHERIRFVSLDVHAGSKEPARARTGAGGRRLEARAQSTGDGPVDADVQRHPRCFRIRPPCGCSRSAPSPRAPTRRRGSTVRLEEGGKLVDGQGADTDTIVAAARAYVHALNKLLVKRTRGEPAEITAAMSA